MRPALFPLVALTLLSLGVSQADATPITWSLTGVMTGSTTTHPDWTFPVGTGVTFTVDMDPHATNLCAGYVGGGLYQMGGGSYSVAGNRYNAGQTFLEVNSPLGACGFSGITGYTLRFFDFDHPLALSSAFVGWSSVAGSAVPTLLPTDGYFSVFGIGGLISDEASANGLITDAAVVPEPMTLSLLSTGLGLIAFRCHRTRTAGHVRSRRAGP